jgi:ABC-2 type transport system permease protein
VGVQTYRLDERGTRAEIADRSAVALPLVTVLYFMVLLYGMSIMTSVTEEKANRTAELLFSSVRPFELLGGKLLGVGAAALLQTTVWGLAALAVVALAPRAGGLGELARLGPGALTAFAFFLSAGFLLYGTLYLAMGAIAGSTEEAQHLNLPVTAFAALGFFLSIYVMDRPDTTLAIVLSLVPLFAPMLLFARLIVSGVPAWQMVVGVALLAAAIAANLGIAARIYRTAMLLHGRRPRVSELAAWLRRS